MATGQYDYQMLQQLQSINSVLNNIFSLLQGLVSTIQSGYELLQSTFPFYSNLFMIILFCLFSWFILDLFFPRGSN